MASGDQHLRQERRSSSPTSSRVPKLAWTIGGGSGTIEPVRTPLWWFNGVPDVEVAVESADGSPTTTETVIHILKDRELIDRGEIIIPAGDNVKVEVAPLVAFTEDEMFQLDLIEVGAGLVSCTMKVFW